MYKQKSLKIYNERNPLILTTINEMSMIKTNGELFI